MIPAGGIKTDLQRHVRDREGLVGVLARNFVGDLLARQHSMLTAAGGASDRWTLRCALRPLAR